MNLQLISNFRTELMGFAMLIVVWFHLPISTHITFIDFLKGNGCIGVDIFLLLSGFGLAYSTKNKFHLSTYLIKRAVRIFPVYTLIIFGVSLIKADLDITNLFYKITTIGWWINGTAYDWFIPNLLLLYLLFPLFFLLTRSQRYGIVIGCIIIVLMYIFTCSMPYNSNFQSYCRYPIFFLGAILGRLSFSFSKVNLEKVHIGLIIASVIGVGLSIWAESFYYQPDHDPSIRSEIVMTGWKFFPYFWIAPGVCMMMGYVFYKLKTFNSILKWIGSMSLEIYLIHGQFILLTRYISDTYGLNKQIVGFIFISLSFLVAYMVHLLNLRMMAGLNNVFLKNKREKL